MPQQAGRQKDLEDKYQRIRSAYGVLVKELNEMEKEGMILKTEIHQLIDKVKMKGVLERLQKMPND